MNRKWKLAGVVGSLSLISVSFFNCAKTDNSALLQQRTSAGSISSSESASSADSGSSDSSSTSSSSSGSGSSGGSSSSGSMPVGSSPGMPTSSPTASPSPTTAAQSCNVTVSSQDFDVKLDVWETTATATSGIVVIEAQCDPNTPFAEWMAPNTNKRVAAGTFPPYGLLNCKFRGKTQSGATVACGPNTSGTQVNFRIKDCGPMIIKDPLICNLNSGRNGNVKAKALVRKPVGYTIQVDYVGNAQPNQTEWTLENPKMYSADSTNGYFNFRFAWTCQADGNWAWALGPNGRCTYYDDTYTPPPVYDYSGGN